MSLARTYLEFSEIASNSHKFYEVIVKSTEVSIRFGRIGEQGQTQTKIYTTSEQAQREAEKKIREKLRKGYVNNTANHQIQTLSVQQSVDNLFTVVSSTASTQKAPLVWRFISGSQAFGLFVSSDYCWIGNQQGRVFRLDLQGEVINQYQLPAGVKCIVEDDIWLYVGCDNGNVYDLTGKLVRLAYEIDRKVDILWLDIHDGILAVADADGGLAKIDPEGEVQWTRLSPGKLAWMIRGDDRGFYHGHSSGVTLYDRDLGKQIWHQPIKGSVLFGWQEKDIVYAGTSGKKIIALDKATGEVKNEYQCDTSVYSCATAAGGEFVFAGDSAASIYCFNRQGQRLWKLMTGCGSALSMQFRNDRLYLATTDGTLACIDVTSNEIKSTQTGELPQAIACQASTSLTSSTPISVETMTNSTQGVLVECVRRDGKLRIRAISPGYHHDWMVQFPRDIREEGAKYLVQELRQARQGNFYRAYGDIQKLV